MSTLRTVLYNRWVLVLNGVLAVALLAILLSSDRMKTILGIEPTKQPHPTALDYRNNALYGPQLEFIRNQSRPARILFLGDSHSALTDWSELLNRCDLANQGIRGDVTTGMLARIQWVVTRKPAICFLEGGSNDISFDVPEAVILRNLAALVDTLRRHQITPILHTVTKVTPSNPEKTFNTGVTSLNTKIRNWCRRDQIAYIDLDQMTDSAGYLKTSFAISDGIHYSYTMYRLWATEIQKLLRQYAI
jgi:lysophospholipase L1-like esterase